MFLDRWTGRLKDRKNVEGRAGDKKEDRREGWRKGELEGRKWREGEKHERKIKGSRRMEDKKELDGRKKVEKSGREKVEEGKEEKEGKERNRWKKERKWMEASTWRIKASKETLQWSCCHFYGEISNNLITFPSWCANPCEESSSQSKATAGQPTTQEICPRFNHTVWRAEAPLWSAQICQTQNCVI